MIQWIGGSVDDGLANSFGEVLLLSKSAFFETARDLRARPAERPRFARQAMSRTWPKVSRATGWCLFALAGASNLYLLYVLYAAFPSMSCSRRVPCGHATAAIETR